MKTPEIRIWRKNVSVSFQPMKTNPTAMSAAIINLSCHKLPDHHFFMNGRSITLHSIHIIKVHNCRRQHGCSAWGVVIPYRKSIPCLHHKRKDTGTMKSYISMTNFDHSSSLWHLQSAIDTKFCKSCFQPNQKLGKHESKASRAFVYSHQLSICNCCWEGIMIVLSKRAHQSPL